MDDNDPFIDLGIYLLESFDESKYVVELLRYDDFNSAKNDLYDNKISVLFSIPADFSESINNLSNDSAITYYTAAGNRGIGGIYMDELSNLASNYILYSEKGILSLIEYLDSTGSPSNQMYEETDELFMAYMGTMLNRGELVETQELGISNGLSTVGFFFTGLSLFFVSVLSFAGIAYFLGKNQIIGKIAYSKGIGAIRQATADFLAYYLCNFLCVLVLMIPVAILLKVDLVSVPELYPFRFGKFFGYFRDILIAMVLLTIFQMLIYELLDGTINKIIFSFVIIVGSGYVSGYLYPKNFFPEIVCRVGEVLPTGVALSFLSSSLVHGCYDYTFWVLVLYCVVLFAALCFARLRNIKK